MFVRPRRYRMIMAFLLGLAVSVALLAGGYFYYRSHIAGMESEMRTRIGKEIQTRFDEAHPLEVAYVFAKDKKAGETISDSDIVPSEVNKDVLPTDAITSPEQALGKVMRCSIASNTIISGSIFFSQGDYPDDLRVMEYTVINLPSKLETGSFIDVRIMFPNGLDYIVLTKKEVIDRLQGENGNAGMLWLHMNEEEILRMSSAIVDASLVEGSKLYAVSYVAPDIQKEAVKTYPANNEVLGLILTNPNIVDKAVETLESRNRAAFEERMNQDLEDTGKRGVYGAVDEKAAPVENLMDQAQTKNEEETSGSGAAAGAAGTGDGAGTTETGTAGGTVPADGASLDDRL